MPLKTLRERFVFVDEAGFTSAPNLKKVWADLRLLGPNALVYEDPRLNSPIHSKYCAAVNAVHGSLFIKFFSGSTGIKPSRVSLTCSHS